MPTSRSSHMCRGVVVKIGVTWRSRTGEADSLRYFCFFPRGGRLQNRRSVLVNIYQVLYQLSYLAWGNQRDGFSFVTLNL